ncbi:nuclear transport factor 2 family protein [bacterium SCSIO 12696]|nr:nuclear transport factor 2 family protein [bacterium SCSIO 12696]
MYTSVETPPNSFNSQNYQNALARYPGTLASDEDIQRFASVYGDLKSKELNESINSLYAESLYFNDTFNTFEHRNELRDYLVHTANNLITSEVVVDDVARSGNEVYLRWTMTISLSVKGKVINSESAGVTHLRFNPNGKVIVHQDFWDGVDGFYQHLPYLGGATKLLREQL